MVIEKEKIKEYVDLEGHLRVINLFPLFDNFNNLVLENIEVGDRHFDFCKHYNDIVIKSDDGRVLSAHANFMEEYNDQHRPKSLVGFKYKVDDGYFKVTSKLDNRWMQFGYYPDDHIDEREMMQNISCETDALKTDYSKYMLTSDEIGSVCKHILDQFQFIGLEDDDKKISSRGKLLINSH